jgi:hypothetical protein
MDMEKIPTSSEIYSLFVNDDPDEVWGKAAEIIARAWPAFDLSVAHSIFNDVMRLFNGQYPGYCAIKTPYHDLSHTLDVFMCAIRLAHGTHLSGIRLLDDEVSMIVIAALMHDIGYAQRPDEDTGTGAQFTKEHVRRGIAFMRGYLASRGLPAAWADRVEPMMQSTDHMIDFNGIGFPDQKTKLLAQIIATADLVGQMSDRVYLEKLLYLYMEFEEAQLGNYRSAHDLLCKSINFYEATRQQRLDGELGGLYKNLTFHFRDHFGREQNYYVESLEKNMAYLSQATQLDEAGCLAMLKRGGIVEKAMTAMDDTHPGSRKLAG